MYVKMLSKIPVTHCATQGSLGRVCQGKVETAGPSGQVGGAGVAQQPRSHSFRPVRGASRGRCGHHLHVAGQEVTLTAHMVTLHRSALRTFIKNVVFRCK